MAANKRTDKQIEEDKLFISKELVKSTPYRKIAELLNAANKEAGKDYTLVYSQIAYDVKKILQDWREERKETIDLVVDRELRKLDVIEAECWAAWEKSKGGKRTTKINGGSTDGGTVAGGSIKERSIEETFGDVRFLDKVMSCMDRRKELLGYAAPKKVEFSGSVGVGVTPMSEEDIEKEKARILKNMGKSADAN